MKKLFVILLAVVCAIPATVLGQWKKGVTSDSPDFPRYTCGKFGEQTCAVFVNGDTLRLEVVDPTRNRESAFVQKVVSYKKMATVTTFVLGKIVFSPNMKIEVKEVVSSVDIFEKYFAEKAKLLPADVRKKFCGHYGLH